jgi:hypothetical protein
MSESTATTDTIPISRLDHLEERVTKLETALAERPSITSDDAVAERVLTKLAALAGEPHATDDKDRVLVLASSTEPATLVRNAPAPPDGAVMRPPEPPVDPTQRKWFLTQLWSEFRLVIRMYFDHRYRISRTLQVAIIGIIALLVLNYFLFSVLFSIPILSPILQNIFTIVLGILGYKFFMRETVRYREVVSYWNRYGQR